MKIVKLGALFVMLAVLFSPQMAGAIGFEVAVGVWNQDPSGDLAYQGTSLDLANDLKYGSQTKFFGRAKIDMPLIIPNIYVMATPMKFDGAGSKAASFTFANRTYSATAPFTSEVKLDHYDVALYYGIPFVNTATVGMLNVDVGLNLRVIDFSAEIVQPTTSISESKTATLPVPMVYVGVQFKPIDALSLEGEVRGVAYNANHYYDLIARAKYKFLGLAFVAAGYRYEDLKIDEEDVRANVTMEGPFAEAGVEF